MTMRLIAVKELKETKRRSDESTITVNFGRASEGNSK